ncbi:MAG: UvrD-helicase domain-containing protein [Clostridia bacterium]
MSNNLNNEQIKVLTTQGNMLVSASAGSGKTSTVIQKIMDIISKGVDIRRILIMTFTKAAANEMKERLIGEIYRKVRLNDANSTVLLNQLNNLPFSNISTIHSFCYELYKKYFAIIKTDPSSEMLDESQSANILEQTIDEIVEDYIAANDQDFLELANHFSRTRKLDDFKDRIRRLNSFLGNIEDLQLFQKNMEDGTHTKRCMDFMNGLIDENTIEIVTITREYIYVFDELSYAEDLENAMKNLGICDKILNINSFEDKINLLNYLNLSRIKSKGKEITEYYNLIKGQKETLQSILDLGTSENNYADANKMFEVTIKVRNSYMDYKKKHNTVDFDDLGYYSLKILENENARKEIKESFDFIFVDEYQDTNYAQEKMLGLIASEDNVIVVGDPKQAIYQFRGAEPKIFIDRMHIYESMPIGSNIYFTQNYRSDKEILPFVNNIFDEIMTQKYCGIDYKNQSELQGGVDYGKVNDLEKCVIYTYQKDADKEKTEDAPNGFYSVKDAIIENKVNIESEFIAGKIIEMANKKLLGLRDNEVRPIKYSDIAILVRTHNQEDEVVSCLKQHGIPVNHKCNGGDILPEREVLIDYLRLLNNINQDIPLANVLLSPLYDFDNSELMEIHNSNRKLRFAEAFLQYTGENKIQLKRDKVVDDIKTFRFQSAYKPISSLIVDIMAMGGYDSYLMTKDKAVVENINVFLENLSGCDYDNNLDDFLFYYDNLYRGDSLTFDNNAVIVTTIHQSKGLEYPIVFLPMTASSLGHIDNSDKLYFDRDLGIGVLDFISDEYKTNDNIATFASKRKKEIKNKQELGRLLYVALTRAKNHLFVIGKETKGDKVLKKIDSFMGFLEYTKERNANFSKYWQEIDISQINYDSKQEQISEMKVDLPINLDSLQWEYPHINSVAQPAKYTVSQLIADDNQAKKIYTSTSPLLGIAYHTVMQYIDYNCTTANDIKKQLNLMKENQIIDDEMLKLIDIDLMCKVMQSEIIKLAQISKVYREQPFMMYTNEQTLGEDKVLIQGVIDLLIVNENTTLVDFKLSNGNPNYLKNKYKSQLDLYAKAVEMTMKIPVKRKIIYNILLGEVIEI